MILVAGNEYTFTCIAMESAPATRFQWEINQEPFREDLPTTDSVTITENGAFVNSESYISETFGVSSTNLACAVVIWQYGEEASDPLQIGVILNVIGKAAVFHETWEENYKEGIETSFKTHLSSVSAIVH